MLKYVDLKIVLWINPLLAFFTPKGATFVAALANCTLATLGTHYLAEGSKPLSFQMIAKVVISHPFAL